MPFRRGRGSRSFDRRTMLDSRVCFEKSPLPSFPTEVLPFSQPLPSLGADLWEEKKAKSCQIAFGARNRHYATTPLSTQLPPDFTIQSGFVRGIKSIKFQNAIRSFRNSFAFSLWRWCQESDQVFSPQFAHRWESLLGLSRNFGLSCYLAPSHGLLKKFGFTEIRTRNVFSRLRRHTN